ncbi:single-pass membrane and coiled-coil domain-containing protein 1 isoform X2 [Hemicordylus capensis]|uniref:single-pass membrane and coiled-coil domain-containing protein 1 isoform X2 n=1 Tax=Hemicordylus capensis TaxID=884348 RepID=UPI002302A362|nr:single-pass membrane and coiled-coil domain-containing protein 1 isoform X2 [Hemicordylus capensis]
MNQIGVENKLQTIEAQFTVLDSSMQKLLKKFEFQSTALEDQVGQDEMWASLLEERFTSIEVNLFYSYICETINCLHSQVVQKLPDLAGALCTLSSILRRKGKNQRIRSAWESALDVLGFQEADIKALCAFFMIHSYDACYYPANQRQNYTSDISSVINKAVKNQLFKHSLLCAVCVVENRKA